jgi:creatinine amidohydrolase
MVLSDYEFAEELKEKLGVSPNDGHAGTVETSRLMAIRPDLVKGKSEACFPKMPRFEVVADPERFFPTGVMGDPTAASEKMGKTINEYVVEQVVKLVEELARD